MNNISRNLDNTAKVFSLDKESNNNTFRLSIILKEKIDFKILSIALNKSLNNYPSYKVKIKSGLFWNYLKFNKETLKIEKNIPFDRINFKKNNGYLFKLTYTGNQINLDVYHVLTDGLGAINFLKDIVCNYLNIKYNIKENKKEKNNLIEDANIINADKKLITNKYKNKVFLIKEKCNIKKNKTKHYILDLKQIKIICKKNKVSISEYLTAIYIYAIYKTIYNKSSNKDIVVSIPIDLRKYYNVESLSNFFTCMSIESNVKNKTVSFDEILKQVHKEFKNKLTSDNVKKYLARDVKLGTNIGIKIIPLFIKKSFIRHFGKILNQSSTTTLSNIGVIKFDEVYNKYIDNVYALVSINKYQKIKCTICSYENNLNIIINSNLITNKLEDEFCELLKEHIGKIKLESNVI